MTDKLQNRAETRADPMAAADLLSRPSPSASCSASSIPCPGSAISLGDILFAAGWVALFGRRRAVVHRHPRHDCGPRRRCNPNGVPEHLVTSGPFGVTRNPMYLANTLLLIGVAFISGIVWFLPLALIAAFATQKVAIESEEKILAAKFGKKYRDYAKRVRRWI